MKRQIDDSNRCGILKKRPKTVLSEDETKECFRQDLFDKSTLQKYVEEYTSSKPYKHGVICSLINDKLLRSVRAEIQSNVHFTPKETDIYKIHQSGDLANLDGLDDGALEKLPSLLQLRDALYSSSFRDYIATITGSGDLSGRKTDMAINVYTPGCYLLCHDDVIGSRRVSYILYLTDPDIPWKKDWGGALRLYPTEKFDEYGEKTVTPYPDPEKNIPPAWNQMSFFSVKPGESFHDVEEVYHPVTNKQLIKDGGRIRMAISGWYHIPQNGEKGYVEGEEESWGKNSSLKQLQRNLDQYDLPKPQPTSIEPLSTSEIEDGLSESDLDFLLKYIAPTYLTPDTLSSISSQFIDLSYVVLDSLLSKNFSSRIRSYIEAEETLELSNNSVEIEKSIYKVARPPHKHRYLYIKSNKSSSQQETLKQAENPIEELLTSLLPSKPFRRWLQLSTTCKINSFDIIARRFRRGFDYSLATNYDGEPRLEISLGLTPTQNLVEEDEESSTFEPNLCSEDSSFKLETSSYLQKDKTKNDMAIKLRGNSKETSKPETKESEPRENAEMGGYEIYMAGDEDENEDAAIYKENLDADDNILLTIPPSWNKLSIVLRDPGVLKFMKYVSKNAKSGRWDMCCAYGVINENYSDNDEDKNGEDISINEENEENEERSDEEFHGFSDSE